MAITVAQKLSSRSSRNPTTTVAEQEWANIAERVIDKYLLTFSTYHVPSYALNCFAPQGAANWANVLNELRARYTEWDINETPSKNDPLIHFLSFSPKGSV